MDKDRIATIAGLIVGAGVTLGVLTQEQAGVLTQAAGILVGLAIIVWGYVTNKS